MTDLAWASLSTPVGPVSVGCSSAGVASVRFGGPGHPVPGCRRGATCLADVRAQLAEYFRGQREAFDLPLDWSLVPGLGRRLVLEMLHQHVGYGQTITYGALARQAGLPQDGPELPARAVGRIMGSNPIPLVVPCHRVVAGDGVGGYSGGTGPEVKRWLLILEGVLPPTLDWEPATTAG